MGKRRGKILQIFNSTNIYPLRHTQRDKYRMCTLDVQLLSSTKSSCKPWTGWRRLLHQNLYALMAKKCRSFFYRHITLHRLEQKKEGPEIRQYGAGGKRYSIFMQKHKIGELPGHTMERLVRDKCRLQRWKTESSLVCTYVRNRPRKSSPSRAKSLGMSPLYLWRLHHVCTSVR